MVTDPVTFIELDSVDSTNSWLLGQVRDQKVTSPTTVVAHQQSQGRGRMGRAWKAQPGHSLCLSLALPFNSLPASWVTLLTGVKVCQFLERRSVAGLGLKWPNDLMVGDRKLGGILCESLSVSGRAFLIVGIGINLLPVDTENQSVSLSDLGAWSAEDQVLELATDLSNELSKAIVDGLSAGFASVAGQCRSLDVLKGLPVKVMEQDQLKLQGTAQGVNEDGAYLIETEQGLQAIQSGDLSLRRACHD